jgi:hypothetical protein
VASSPGHDPGCTEGVHDALADQCSTSGPGGDGERDTSADAEALRHDAEHDPEHRPGDEPCVTREQPATPGPDACHAAEEEDTTGGAHGISPRSGRGRP